MYTRLHGILSDIVVESHGLEGIDDPRAVVDEIRERFADLEDIQTEIRERDAHG